MQLCPEQRPRVHPLAEAKGLGAQAKQDTKQI